MDDYQASELVQVMHDFPHITFKFKLLENPMFDLENHEYVETLVMVALFPLVVLVLSMVGFLIYYCCVKLKRAAPSKMKSSSCYCSVCLIVVFIMVALGSISVIVYGTIEAHEGITMAANAASKINDFSLNAVTELNQVNDRLTKLEVDVVELNETIPNHSSIDEMKTVVEILQSTTARLSFYSLEKDVISWEQILLFLQNTELYRSIITYSLIGVQGFICLLTLVGICFRSRCFLLTAVFTGLLCLVVSYVYIGTALTANVATADICVNPYSYMYQGAGQLSIDSQVADYFLTCPDDSTQNPFTKIISNATTHLHTLDGLVMTMAGQNPSDDVIVVLDRVNAKTVDLLESVEMLKKYLDCEEYYSAVNDLVAAVCVSSFEGIFILCVATLSVCLALTIVMCAAPQTWKRFYKTKRAEELDLDDVFLPPPARQASVSRTNNPLYISPEERFARRISSNPTPPAATNTLSFFRQSDENVHLIDQPPPAYSPPSPGTSY